MISVGTEKYFSTCFISQSRFGASTKFLMRLLIQLYSYSFHPDLTLKPEMWLEYLATEGRKKLITEI